MNPALKEARSKVESFRKELAKILDEAGPDLDMKKVTSVDGPSDVKVAYFQSLNEQLNDAMKALEPLESEHSAMVAAKERIDRLGAGREPGEAGGPPSFANYPDQPQGKGRPAMDFGKALYDEWAIAGKVKGKDFTVDDVDVKTLMSTGAGWAAPVIRTGRLVEDEQRPIQVLDIIPSTTTTAVSVVYMEETTFTNAAAETAESVQATPGVYPEAALALTEQTSPVRKVAVFLPVTDEQLDDIPQVQGYINNRLPFMLRQRLDAQVITGNGTAPNLRGILNVAGIQTQARGTDPVPDAIYKAMVKVRVNGRANPTAVAIHSTDWQNIRLLRTADGLYIWGNPSEGGVERIWGLPVVQNEVLTAGTALVGDFATYSELAFRKGVEVKISDSHGDYFIQGKQAIRADLRAAFIVYRPTAFSTVTGL